MADLFANPNALPSRERSSSRSAPAPRRTPPPPPRRSAPSRSEGPPAFSGEDGERAHPKYIGFTEADDPWIPRTSQPTSQVPAGTGRFLARDPRAGYTSLQRPLYTTEHINDIYGMPPQAIADLQDHLVATGILTGKVAFRYRAVDPVEHQTHVVVEIPIQADRDVFLLSAEHQVVVEVHVAVARRDLPSADAACHIP